MPYHFDQPIDRTNTQSIKWDFNQEFFGNADLLPMWVADMDFETAPAVKEALKERVAKGHFGYTKESEAYYEGILQWMQQRHNWPIQKDWIHYVPGLIPALNFCVQAFTNPGDEVIVQPPVYKPFFTAVANNDRTVLKNPLTFNNGHYQMDLDALKQKITSRTKMLILCSPHNPVGRVWTKGELQEISQFCLDHNILLVSDEIHMDIVYTGHQHTPVASLSEAIAQNTITLSSPGKTFNLQGFQTGYAIIPDSQLRQTFAQIMEQNGLFINNILSMKALESAYNQGAEWLDALLVYLENNLNFLDEYLQDHLPQIRMAKPQGTYLAWLDFRELGMEADELHDFLVHQAGIGLNSGTFFGEEGAGFERLNFACPRPTLEKGLDLLKKAL